MGLLSLYSGVCLTETDFSVEFNVDLNLWDVVADPIFPDEVSVILIYDKDRGFPLEAEGVDTRLFDWKGQPL